MSSKVFGTLCLHPGANQSQRVTGHLATGAGYSTTPEQHQNAGVGRVFGVVGQPQVLQTLATIMRECENDVLHYPACMEYNVQSTS